MENMELSILDIYKDKKVFITGNTGFKGSWLSLMINHFGGIVTGYSLHPITTPSHFELLDNNNVTYFENILNPQKLYTAIQNSQPDIIFHLAAQPLVRQSYIDPLNTYQSNVIGTLNVLEAAKKCNSVKAILLITTDKVYDNKETFTPYKEEDELGGYDMYSSSKACAEILIKSYRNSFLNVKDYKINHNILLATARAGNVIGGGDWSSDRLIPDIAVATSKKQKVLIRNPLSVRPWQHVLDCLYGYMLLGAKLLQENTLFAEPFNFSPSSADAKTVEEVAIIAKQTWTDIEIEFGVPPENFHEAGLLILDNSKALKSLNWKPVWNTTESIEKTILWYKNYYIKNKVISKEQITEFFDKAKLP